MRQNAQKLEEHLKAREPEATAQETGDGQR